LFVFKHLSPAHTHMNLLFVEKKDVAKNKDE